MSSLVQAEGNALDLIDTFFLLYSRGESDPAVWATVLAEDCELTMPMPMVRNIHPRGVSNPHLVPAVALSEREQARA